MSRLFLSVRPPSEVSSELHALRTPDDDSIRWVAPEQMHVTLRFLGNARAADVVEALVGKPMPPSVARLGPRVTRLGPRVVMVPVSGLDHLAAVVRSATEELGDPPDPRGFRAHLTLARLKGRGTCGAMGVPVSLQWPVEEIELVSSVTDPGGAKHDVVRYFALGGGGRSSRNA